jgi:hypothetical protein
MEGRLEVALPGTRLQPKPVHERTLVIVRIADTRPHGTLTWYDLRYIALVPGHYDLRDHLRRTDGGPTTDLPALPVRALGLLPDPHSGQLVEPASHTLSIFGRYRVLLWSAAGLWLVTGTLLFALRRHRRPSVPCAALPPTITLADRLRPLIEQAADGRLSAEGKAQLERLLLTYWHERLDLHVPDYAETLPKLHAHPEAGPLLRSLESWLHRPPGSAQVDVPALLAPYRESATGPARASTDRSSPPAR